MERRLITVNIHKDAIS